MTARTARQPGGITTRGNGVTGNQKLVMRAAHTALCRECGRPLTAPKTIARRLCRSCWRVAKLVNADATT